ncbi:MAG: tetratricopeptide repeat protein [Acidobacteriota bacterium]
MSFDKTKAMRNAEKYVAQGKIRSAIAEYRAVVDNDPRDIGTLNMLGDLHAKSSEKRQAVDCYMLVAEHYSKQGFAQKAIAIYNKISRLQPESIEVSTKLAELYTVKGSLAEARSHYTALAEHYEKAGRRIEALAMWKQIALLDPNNTDVCMNLADSYLREGHRDDAAEAYSEAGSRFSRKGENELAISALMKGHDIRPTDLRILDGLIHAYSALGRVGKAVRILEEILEKEPYNRDVLYLLIDCHIDAQNAAGAEKEVIKLVAMEPANYPKLLDLIRIYLNADDTDSAARILSMSSEYLLAAGQGEECQRWITEILERDPDHLSALGLLVRYCSWVKDESAYSTALARLAEAANKLDSPEDERFALSHLVITRPFQTEYVTRLAEINETHGFEPEPVDAELVKAQFRATETASFDNDEAQVSVVERPGFRTADDFEVERSGTISDETTPAPTDFAFAPAVVDESDPETIVVAKEIETPAEHAEEQRFDKEIESVRFYVENGYRDLAEKALSELAEEFGERPLISQLREQLDHVVATVVDNHSLSIDEIRTEFGLEETEPSSDLGGDYDTFYQMGVAYQEMGLMEQAIKEYQDAINLVSPTDGTRRFFQCANLMGHCFLQNGMSNFAVTWFQRALETPDLNDHEYQGLWYELACAFEAGSDVENAAKYFERVYAENVDFRDVADRVRQLAVGN